MGLKLEIAGLILILVAAVWQSAFNDWFARADTDGIAYTQESVNFASLYILKHLSSEIAAEDQATRLRIDRDVSKSVAKAVSDAIAGRENRRQLNKGQGKAFGTVRFSLAVGGAILIILGKTLVFVHKRQIATPPT